MSFILVLQKKMTNKEDIAFRKMRHLVYILLLVMSVASCSRDDGKPHKLFIVLPRNVKKCFTGLSMSIVSKCVLWCIEEEQLAVETAVTPSTI